MERISPLINRQKIQKTQQIPSKKIQQEKVNFREILGQRVERVVGIKFSKHALQRIQQRGIEVTEEHLGKIRSTLEKVASKGAKDSLLIMDGMVMIVSVANRTVVTCVGKEDLKENIFTNIDSAAIL